MRISWFRWPEPGTIAKEFAAVPFRFFQYSANHGALLQEREGSVKEESVAKAELLDIVEERDASQLHLATISQHFKVSGDTARATVDDLLQEGLVETTADLVPRIKAAFSSLPPALRINRLVWITRNRSEQALQGIEAFALQTAMRGRRPTLEAVDDSDDSLEAAALKTGLCDIAAKTGLPFRYFGRPEKAEWLHALAEEAPRRGVSPAILDTLYKGVPDFGSAHGVNRNFAFALSRGSNVLWNDDDILPRYASWKADHAGTHVTSDFSPHVIVPFADRSAAYEAANLVDIDWLAEHEAALGVPRIEDPVSLAGAAPDLLDNFLSGECHSVVTNAGICGETAGRPQFASLFWPIQYRGLEGLEEKRFYALLGSSEFLLAVPRRTYAASPFYTGMQSAMRCDFPLPPFFPRFTGEDMVFGALLRRVAPKTLIGFIPISVLHDRRGKRIGTRRDMVRPTLELNSLIRLLMDEWVSPVDSCDIGDRYRSLGGFLRSAGELGSFDFAGIARELLLRRVTMDKVLLETLVAEKGDDAPWWREDARRYIRLYDASLVSDKCLVPREFEGNTVEGSLDLVRYCLRRFGAVVERWPEVLELLDAVPAVEFASTGGLP